MSCPSKFEHILTKEFLIEEYLNKNRYAKEIAKDIGTSETTVRRHILKFELRKLDPYIFIDLTGQKFGNWTVVKIATNRKNKETWTCQCKCDNHTISNVSRERLTSGRSQSCGCMGSHKFYEELSGTFWSTIRVGAQARNINFNLSQKEAWDLYIKQNRKCALSGIKIQFAKSAVDFAEYQTASLDRIDSSKGYSIDNIQWIHKRLNIMKLSDSQSDFINWCHKVSLYNKPTN